MAARLFCSRNYLAQVETGAKEPSQRLLQFLESLAAAVLPENTNQPSLVVAENQAPYRAEPNGRIVAVTEKLRAIRVVSWAHAGEAGSYEQIPDDEQEQIVTASSDPKAFAVTVEGESMLPDYKPGDRVVLAPSRLPLNGRPVVVKLADDGILIRLYHRIDAKTIRLTSLNPDIYPARDLKIGEWRWCWPVEEQIRRHY